MRLLPLIAASAFLFVSAAAQAEPRSLSPSAIDQKLPHALGKAAETPKLVQAPAAAAAQAVEAPKEAPGFVQRPSIAGNKPADSREGQVTFDEGKPASPGATTTAKPKQAKAEKPRRPRQHWDEARIMREIYRYSGYAGMLYW